MDLATCSDEDLLADVRKLTGSHRELTAALVANLAEIEERRLHLLRGFSSMFEFCTKEFRFSEGEAFRRILAARLCRRFPIVVPLLASGRINLSTLVLLREWLTEENHEELLATVADKGKREVQSLIAARFPRPDRPSRIRKRARIEPLSEARFAIEFTAGEAFCQKLELCRDLMSHANPNMDIAVVIERALDLLLAELERRRLGKAKRPRRAASAKAGGSPRSASSYRSKPSHIVNATRRDVFERDGLQCTYVAENGRRCEARAFLELDHVDPKALGGQSDTSNLRVLCRAHNQLAAEQVFGRERVDRNRHFRQRKWAVRVTAPVRSEEAERATTFEKVRRALRNLGFRDGVARRAVAAVAELYDSRESVALERALREALLAATAACVQPRDAAAQPREALLVATVA